MAWQRAEHPTPSRRRERVEASQGADENPRRRRGTHWRDKERHKLGYFVNCRRTARTTKCCVIRRRAGGRIVICLVQ